MAIVINVTKDYIEFDNGLKLSSDHNQDCCEHHWLDFSYVKLNDFDNLEFDLSNDNFFSKIPGYGIALHPIQGFPVRIPGYGSNNGYYSDNLELVLSGPGTHKGFDISDCQEVDE